MIIRYKLRDGDVKDYTSGMQLVSRDGVCFFHVNSPEGRAILDEEKAQAEKDGHVLTCTSVNHETGEYTMERLPPRER